MTTPERFRRRQLVEGAMLVVIGLLMIGQSFYFYAEDRDQRRCLIDNFQQLSSALEVRSTLNGRETEATRRVNLAELRVQSDEEYLQELDRYRKEIQAIQQEREENPLPPYPAGECQ